METITGVPKTSKQKIEEDLQSVDKRIVELLFPDKSKDIPNFKIVQRHYIHPSVISTVVPLSDPTGEYQYYIGIRAALEHAIVYGSVPKKMLPYKSPEYLHELVED